MTNINSDYHYLACVCLCVCVCALHGEREGLCVCIGIYIQRPGKHKQKVFYLFLSLIAEITVYFQTAPRCGELAGLSEHPHRTEGDG